MINIFQPTLGDGELDAVRRVFESNWLGRGSENEAFEREFASYQGVDRQTMQSVSCCTEGIFAVLKILGIGPDDEVVMPSISFVGAGNAVLSRGAKLVLCDVDPLTLNPTAAHLKAVTTKNTRCYLIIHYGGVPCDMDSINAVAKENDVIVIEDSACSVASRYRGKACGTLGDFGVWSFDAMKILVCGDGGMIYAKDVEHRKELGLELYLGLTSKSGVSNMDADRWWEFNATRSGRRDTMNDISSSIGRVQLKRLPSFIERRKQIHQKYDKMLGDADWFRIAPSLPGYCESSYYFYTIQAKNGERNKLAQYLRAQNIYTTFRYFPLHRVKLYNSQGSFPGSDQAADETLCIPIHQALSDENIDQIVNAILEFPARA
jgi:aminotransferase